MSRVARRFVSGSVMSGVAMVGLLVSPAQARSDCLKKATCDADNGYDSQLTGMNDVEFDDDGCLAQWDCAYDDGTQIRHLVLN